ncbi:MAG: hypothetical protein DWQ08_09275 [Proteobacteria bacterium]|nr:MAG: hypothetical protein DWQ08_09275 [Pseudomonadota bacterium]
MLVINIEARYRIHRPVSIRSCSRSLGFERYDTLPMSYPERLPPTVAETAREAGFAWGFDCFQRRTASSGACPRRLQSLANTHPK